MLDYLNSLLPRIKQYSKDLDQIAKLYNQPWVVPGTDKHTMIIFQPSGKLIVSVDGVVSDGSWELIPAADAILLNIAGEKRLYHHGFLDSALWALRLVGKPEEVFVLVNQHLIPDLDVSGYLANHYTVFVQDPTNNAIEYESVRSLRNGGEMKIGKWLGYGKTEVRIDNKIPKDGLYNTIWGEVFEILNGKVAIIYQTNEYKQLAGKTLEVVLNKMGGIDPGSAAWLDGLPAPDGRYKRGWLGSLTVKDGKIV